MKKTLLYMAASLLVIGCGSGTGSSKQDETEEDYKEVMDILDDVNRKLEYPSLSFKTAQDVKELIEDDQDLYFDFNEDKTDEEHLSKYKKLQKDIELAHHRVQDFLNNDLRRVKIQKINEDGTLIETQAAYPIYLRKGETLYWDAEFEKSGTLTVYNNDSRSVLRSYKNKKQIADSLAISFNAIYLVEVTPKTTQYVNLNVYSRSSNKNSVLEEVTIQTESENVNRGDFRAKAIDGIKMQNLFEEPRKFTLRGQLKAAFSGSHRALVAVQVPSGAKDILYSLRISTNETDKNSDGEFHKNMDHSYHKVKMLGLPVYESSRSCGLIATILGENVPPREEDAYINMYVFYNAADARKFQDKELIEKLKYNIDYSTIGTQSCDGRIPANGNKTIYLGFENERMRYNNYVWLEAISAVPHTEYVRDKYTIVNEDEDENED